ncbi:MAG: (2Fe-2S)-binding protein [Gammaproteobacteria bacterium]|jgi:carbon-monoxide dehydrogenase small subunit|nr:(2Fe-2S)-binding protein [Gammaproteobacteria bacterium]
MKTIELQINGSTHEVSIEADETLLQVLRNRLDLTGTKKGCDSGGCGCCSVQVDGKVVYSCMMYAAGAAGKAITTIEGLGGGGTALDPLQQAFIDAGAVQCGYCTCGMIMNASELLATTKNPGEDQIRHAIAGNLCRCTGYTKIVDAIKLAAARTGG